ncbi:hypothetical protein GGF32_004017 [Allomyces javanicus]|nr:hypothetical protein GGF32_004017 [Allomyces javanicus]
MNTTHVSSTVVGTIPLTGIDFAMVVRPAAALLEATSQGTGIRIDVGVVAKIPFHLRGKTLTAKGTLSYVPDYNFRAFGGPVGTSTVPFELRILPSADAIPVAVYTTLKDSFYLDVTNLAIAVTWSVSEHTVVTRTSMVPEPLGFLRFLGDKHVSDCAFLAKGSDAPIFASRLMLARSSLFFRLMFSGPWRESSTTAPIPFDSWHAASVVLMLIHIYSGWLPGQFLPFNISAQLLGAFAYDPAKVEYPTWRNFLELAQMLELKLLTLAINRHLVTLLNDQYREFWSLFRDDHGRACRLGSIQFSVCTNRDELEEPARIRCQCQFWIDHVDIATNDHDRGLDR